MTLSAQIRTARLALGWSREQLALHAHVSYSTIARVERGAKLHPAQLLAVVSALDIDHLED